MSVSALVVVIAVTVALVVDVAVVLVSVIVVVALVVVAVTDAAVVALVVLCVVIVVVVVAVVVVSQTVPGKSTSGSADFLKGEAGKRGEESNSREAEGQPILGSRRERDTLISPVPRTGVDTPGQGTEAEGSIPPPPGLEMRGQG